MPIYVYETVPINDAQPGRRFEVSQRMHDAPLSHDPATGEPVRRVISGGLGFLTPINSTAPMTGGGVAATPAAMRTDAHHCGPGCGH